MGYGATTTHRVPRAVYPVTSRNARQRSSGMIDRRACFDVLASVSGGTSGCAMRIASRRTTITCSWTRETFAGMQLNGIPRLQPTHGAVGHVFKGLRAILVEREAICWSSVGTWW
jgi:hypothetical protein